MTEQHTDEEISEAAIAVICLSFNLGGPIAGAVADVCMRRALERSDEHFVLALRALRESLVESQARRLEQGEQDEESIEHFSRHMRQINAVAGVIT